jgi:hypothetical protein
MRPGQPKFRRVILVATALAVAVMSCGREPTGLSSDGIRYSGPIAFNTQFPEGYSEYVSARRRGTGASSTAPGNLANQTAGGVVEFDRVRVVLRNPDGSIAKDTIIEFPAGATEVPVTLNIPLAASTGAGGVALSGTFAYMNGSTVVLETPSPFSVTVVPTVAGSPPPPPVVINVPVIYVGPGSSATTVQILPSGMTVNTRAPFAFTAIARDASGNAVTEAPIVFESLNPAVATIDAGSGSGVAGGTRGTATIRARLIGGASSSATLTVVAPPSSIVAVSGGGQTAPVNANLPNPVVVQVNATDGLPAPGVSVTFAAQNGGSVGSATVISGADGTAQTTWRLGSAPGTQTVTASATGLSGSPVTFSATARAIDPVRLAFVQQPPASAQAGATFTPPVTVQALDATGVLTPAFTGSVTLSLGASAGPGVTLGGTVTVSAVAGIATFTDLRIGTPGTYTLVAAAASLSSTTSSSVQITAGNADRLVFGAYPVAGAVAGTTFDPITVFVKDGLGNPVTTFTGPVALSTVGAAAVADSLMAHSTLVLNGTTTVNAVAGVATFTGISINTAGSHALTASAAGLTGVASPFFSITPAAASALALVSGGGQSAAGGAVLPAPIVVKVTDAFGNAIPGITVNFAPAAASGSVAPTSASTGANGTAQTIWTIGGVAGPMTLNVTSTGLSPNPLVVTATAATTTAAGPATQLVFSQQPTNVAVGAGISPTVVVTAKDANGLVATSFSGNVTLGISVNPGDASLGGTSTVAAVNGIASFPGISLNMTGIGYQLQATSGTLTPATSASFNVTGGAIATTTLNTTIDSLYSFGDQVTKVPTSRDATTAIVAGSYTWVSRNPAVATVNTAGLVTAIANGTTYVVVTEAGGTKDSTRVTVQQRVATVNVTPGNRNIYKTRNFQFSASAVDGRGNPMASAPIVWSTVAPSVATTDTTGKVTAVTLGSTQLRATSGAIIGVANVTVLTPITRVIVGRDSAGVPVTDTTAMASLGIRRAMRAEARDTLDAPMTGVTFTWTSTNPTVALLDTIQPTRATALSNANGITTIQATADGILGSAQLKVAQVLAAIDLSPTPDTIGIGASVQLIARGLDANARFISGGTFTYTSRTPAIATVNSSGLVTGVALGTDSVYATSGAINSNNAIVVVSSTVPASISFGRDTLSVGRGASVSIPIYLSRPNPAAPVTISLAARDTNAYFSAASVTITYPATSGNITLNGRNAGTTEVYALNTSGNGFKGDTAVVAVTANMHITNSNYYLNSGDQVATQVLLSDPSPAGGTYVTFSYGTANRAQVSPDPAFIPAGQLASNIVITALGGVNGSTTITPIATGVNGTPSTLQTYAPILFISSTNFRVGAGQYEPNVYVSTSNNVVNSLPLTFVSTDTNIVTVASSGAIPAGSYYYYFSTKGKVPGTAKVIVTSPGWTPDTVNVVVTTPRTTLSVGTNFQTTSPQQSMTIYATDSTGNGHYRISSLALTVSSSDTNVIKIVDKTPSVAADQYYVSGVRFQMGGSGGTAYVKVVAGGHTPDSVLVNVVGPKLEFNYGSTIQLGKGQYESNVYMYVPNSVVSPLTISLTSANAAKVSVPATVTIPAGTYYVYFNVTAVDTTTLTSLIATAPGYQHDTVYVRVTSPRLNVSGNTTLNAFGATQQYYVYAADSFANAHYRTAPLAVSLTSTNPAVVSVDSSVITISANQYYTNAARITPTGTGTAYIVATAAGHKPDSTLYTVQTPKLNLSWGTQVIGRKQYIPSAGYVYTPDNRTSPLNVTLTQSNPTADSLNTTTPVIPNGTYYVYFDIAGRVAGTDTIIASAPGYLPDTAIVKVSSVKLGYGGGLPGNAQTTSGASTLYVYAFDSTNNARYVLDTVTVMLTSSDTTVIKPAQRYVKIFRGEYYKTFQVNYFGPGSAFITMSDSAGSGYASVNSNTVTVTGPSLLFSSTTAMYGMRQSGPSGGEHYVYTQNNVATNTTVTLTSSAPNVASVPASVVIPAGSNYVYFKITAQDTVGTIQITANAAGFGPPTPITVQVTQPKFVVNTSTSARTTMGPQGINVYATDANGNAHYVTENVRVGLSSSSTSVFTVDSAFVTIPVGNYYNGNARWIPGPNGGTSAQLSVVDCTGVASGCPPTPRATLYAYNGATANLSVVTPLTLLSWSNLALGIGQYVDPVYDGSFYVYTQDYMASNTTVNLTHLGNAIETTTPASVVIASANYYQYFRITGTAAGTDTIQASIASPLHNNASATVTVSPGTVVLTGGWPATLAAVGDSLLVTLQVRDPNASSNRRVAAATTFTLTPNSKVEFRQAGAVVTSVTVPIDGSSVQFYVKSLASGSASIQITNANYQTYNNTATVP